MVINGDTRSLDYSSYAQPELAGGQWGKVESTGTVVVLDGFRV